MTVGPATNTKTISSNANTKLSSLSLLIPASRPATTETVAAQVIAAISAT